MNEGNTIYFNWQLCSDSPGEEKIERENWENIEGNPALPKAAENGR